MKEAQKMEKLEKFYSLVLSSAQTPPPKNALFGAKCPKCGKETTKDDLRKFECCPACFKPAAPEKVKDLIGGITGDQS